MPAPTEGGYDTVPRSLRTPFVEQRNGKPEAATASAEQLRAQVSTAMRDGTAHKLIPLTGQTAGMIHDIVPAAEIIHRIVAEAESTMRGIARLRQGL